MKKLGENGFQPVTNQPRHLGLRDEILVESDNLPDPVLVQEIVEDLEAALEQFRRNRRGSRRQRAYRERLIDER